MACKELAGLRLGLMRTLGIDDEAERQHELAEMGEAALTAGPIQSMMQANDLGQLQRFYEASLARLEERLAATPADDPNLGYLRTLLVLTRKVELDLRHQIDALTAIYQDLETMHDFVHELYPAPQPKPESAHG